jgi:hypothetical protein
MMQHVTVSVLVIALHHFTWMGSTMNAAICGSLSNRAVNAGISLYGTVRKLGIYGPNPL